MSSDSTTEARWPLLNERRTPFPTPSRAGRARKPARSVWLLTGLAFLCGGLVSAAVFSIGWRHQAQRETAARSALATATARVHRLSTQLTAAHQDAAQARLAAARATVSARATAHAAAALAAEVTSSRHAADAVSSSAGGIGTSSLRIGRELQTLLTYLTTTPSDQIDSGYIASQASYLNRQLSALQSAGGNVTSAVARFETELRRLTRDAAALQR